MYRPASAVENGQYELLGRMLNNTSLTTKKVTHNHIIDVGKLLMKQSNVDLEGEKKKAVDAALKEAEKRHSREIRAALKRLEKQMIETKKFELERQKMYYEQLSVRVAEQRDKAEEEMIRELRKLWKNETNAALAAQKAECEREKEAAIEEACQRLTKTLRDQFALEKEIALGEALAKARDGFAVREAASIARTKAECEEKAQKELEQVQETHRQELMQRSKQYAQLVELYQHESRHRKRVERDFREIQSDYARFMDYTDGKFHSDYLMYLRSHGMSLIKTRWSEMEQDHNETSRRLQPEDVEARVQTYLNDDASSQVIKFEDLHSLHHHTPAVSDVNNQQDALSVVAKRKYTPSLHIGEQSASRRALAGSRAGISFDSSIAATVGTGASLRFTPDDLDDSETSGMDVTTVRSHSLKPAKAVTNLQSTGQSKSSHL